MFIGPKVSYVTWVRSVRCLKDHLYHFEHQEIKYQNFKVVAVDKIGSSTDFRAGINKYL
ncbi:hypothetical protein GGD38_007159 [Chitinophagaceae bacterium OAS944]|nr:hypothetical protein [Chitinophagaceae bacterium OAS944]